MGGFRGTCYERDEAYVVPLGRPNSLTISLEFHLPNLTSSQEVTGVRRLDMFILILVIAWGILYLTRDPHISVQSHAVRNSSANTDFRINKKRRFRRRRAILRFRTTETLAIFLDSRRVFL